MEKRKFTRVGLVLEASVTGGQTTAEGEVTNLSLHGAFIKLSAVSFQPGEAVAVALRIAAAGSLPPLWCDATVVRTSDDGVALEFGQMAPESFGQLKNLVAYHAGDPDKILRELAHFIQRGPGREP